MYKRFVLNLIETQDQHRGRQKMYNAYIPNYNYQLTIKDKTTKDNNHIIFILPIYVVINIFYP